MLNSESVETVFESKDWRYSADVREYRHKLAVLLENRAPLPWNSETKKAIFEEALSDYFRRLREDMEVTATASESWKLKQQVIELQAQLEFGKSAKAVTFWDKLNSRINIPYLILLCLAVVLIGGLTLIGLTADMSVSVEFNIGEIIGALLVGTGVAAAGISYATKDRPVERDEREG